MITFVFNDYFLKLIIRKQIKKVNLPDIFDTDIFDTGHFVTGPNVARYYLPNQMTQNHL